MSKGFGYFVWGWACAMIGSLSIILYQAHHTPTVTYHGKPCHHPSANVWVCP